MDHKHHIDISLFKHSFNHLLFNRYHIVHTMLQYVRFDMRHHQLPNHLYNWLNYSHIININQYSDRVSNILILD